ncbi:MAG: sigma-70 family RNA polymerase sigma factor [Acidobacteriaceae bacterium]|nr:sigma-70 family RNA polymerase sigma factor [Acidobacteriaceae bacterium]
MVDSSSKPYPLLNSDREQSERTAPSAAERELSELFDELRIPLLRYLLGFPLPPHDSEDVIQEAFLSLFQQMRRGSSIQSPRGWLFRAVHHLALKRRLRSRKDLESAATLLTAETSLVDSGLNPEDELLFHRTRARLDAVVRALPEQHRWCLYLRAEGLRYREIGEILNISLGAVCGCLQRSLALISRAVQR